MENTKDETIIKLTEDGKVTKRIIKEGIGMQPGKYSTVTGKQPHLKTRNTLIFSLLH
jgi:hypothetical protein